MSQPDQSNLRIHLCKKKKTFFKDDDIFRTRGAKRYYISTSRKNCFVALLKNSKEFSHKWRNLFLLLKFFDLVSNKRFTLLLWMNVTTGIFMGRKKIWEYLSIWKTPQKLRILLQSSMYVQLVLRGGVYCTSLSQRLLYGWQIRNNFEKFV